MRRVIDVRNNELREVMEQPKGSHTDIRCGCGEGHLVVRDGGYGKFLGCSTFPKCRNIYKPQEAVFNPYVAIPHFWHTINKFDDYYDHYCEDEDADEFSRTFDKNFGNPMYD